VRSIEGSAAVFLTFDAGADRGYAAEILDILDAENVRASFGLTGAWAEANPDLVRRIADAGHTIMNHSYDHPSFTGASSTYVVLTATERQAQLARTELALADIAEARGVPYFRPPFGDYDQSVLADAGAAGYRFSILWTIDSGGWRGLSAEEIVDRALTASGGDIVIMHVGSAGDYEALPEIIRGLRSRGLATASIGEALR
jgi:peptidoglycan/xylan/chitin deacetylase (PgdA/CDA1 family)